MRFASDSQRKAVFSNLNRFSMKDDVRKLVAMGEFPVDVETRAAIDALDDAEEIGGDEAVKEQTSHIVSLIVPENDQQENIINQLQSIAGITEGPIEEAAPVVFSMSPVFAVEPGAEITDEDLVAAGRGMKVNKPLDGSAFEEEMKQVKSFERQVRSQANVIAKEQKKSELIDEVVGAIDAVYRDPTPMDPDTRDMKTRSTVYDILDSRLRGDKIVVRSKK